MNHNQIDPLSYGRGGCSTNHNQIDPLRGGAVLTYPRAIYIAGLLRGLAFVDPVCQLAQQAVHKSTSQCPGVGVDVVVAVDVSV